MYILLLNDDLLACLFVAELCTLIFIGGDEALVVQGLETLVVGRLVIEVGLSVGQVALSRSEFAQEVGLVQLCNDLSFVNHAIVIDVDSVDDATDLRADFHLGDGLDGTRCCDTGRDVLLAGGFCGVSHFGDFIAGNKEEQTKHEK